MDHDSTAKKNSAGSLKASITNNNRINRIDLFTDHMDSGKRFHIAPERINNLSDILIFLSTPLCPSCNQSKLTSSERRNLKKWFLKFFGRSILHCNNCGWKHTVKLHQWDRETIIPAIVIVLILIIYSIYCVLTG